MFKKILLLFIIIGLGYYYWTTRPITHGPGVVAPNAPVQKEIPQVTNISFKNYTLDPKAEIHLEARVLAIKKYDDIYSDLTETDIVFAWGPMSDEENLSSLLVRQKDRSFNFKMANPPVEKSILWTHSANMHLIPSSSDLSNKINSLRRGHIVSIKGYLVDARSYASEWELNTSLTREDRGEDSSELVWIKSLSIH